MVSVQMQMYRALNPSPFRDIKSEAVLKLEKNADIMAKVNRETMKNMKRKDKETIERKVVKKQVFIPKKIDLLDMF